MNTTAATKGDDYEQGVDVFARSDYAHAAGHCLKAAQAGHPMAQNNLAAMYFMRQGVTEDSISAHMWAGLAHQNGVSSAGKFRGVFEEKMSNTNEHYL